MQCRNFCQRRVHSFEKHFSFKCNMFGINREVYLVSINEMHSNAYYSIVFMFIMTLAKKHLH